MTEKHTEELVAEYKEMAERLGRAKEEIHKVIYGQDEVVTNVLTCMISGGHALLVGPPGVAKTLLVNTISQVMGVEAKRIQFTPDLMPSDILGSEVLETDEKGNKHFRFVPGPIFTQMLLADEINRASPRTQSALLQAMQEGFVTVNGTNYPLPKPFFVLATQNPLEQEGTYPLPEAQRDRFLMHIDVDYPEEAAELKITAGARARKVRKSFEELNPGKTPPAGMVFAESDTKAEFNKSAKKLEQIMTAEHLLRAQELLDLMPPNEDVVKDIVRIVRAGRPQYAGASKLVKDNVEWAPGPRADEALMLCSEARALLRGDLAPSRTDLHNILDPVMKLRMALKWNAGGEWNNVLNAMKGPK